MSNVNREVAVAMSILDDIEIRRGELFAVGGADNMHGRARIVNDLLAEWSVAHDKLTEVQEQGTDVSEELGHLFYVQGQLYTCIVFPGYRDDESASINRYLNKAEQAYKTSLHHDYHDVPQFVLGQVYQVLDRRNEAIEAWKKVEEHGDPELSLKASKSIALLKSKSQKSNSGACFIATTCYGSYDHPDVVLLRRYRDEVLLPCPLGKAFISFYYLIGPSLAHMLERLPTVSHYLREHVLSPLAQILRD